MELTNDQLGYIKSLGVLKTPIEDIPLLLEIEGDRAIELINELKNSNSSVYKIYRSGILKGEIGIKRKMYDKAKEGDTFSREDLEKIQNQERLTNLKEKLFGI